MVERRSYCTDKLAGSLLMRIPHAPGARPVECARTTKIHNYKIA